MFINKLNKRTRQAINFVAIIVLLIIITVLICPSIIYCNDYSGNESTAIYANNAFNSQQKLLSEVKPAASESSDTFYPILITSVVVLGILVFALWQTFKSKRHI